MESFLNQIGILSLIIGFLLDSVLGDPRWLPHPIRWFGAAIGFFEKRWNTGKNRKVKGFITAVILISATWVIIFLIFQVLKPYFYPSLILSSIGIFYGIANHSLIKEAWRVEKALQTMGIEAARRQLSFIVGRDTSKLSPQQIRIAILETLAENLSDGVIAPLFYFALGGVPLMLSYKMANTLDSMIGYKSERYKDFGWFAARFDDAVNFIPARLTAIVMATISFSYRSFKFIIVYGNKHASPNAGYPEAALAGILNTQFGGPNIYHGKQVEKPYIGNNNREIKHTDLVKACIINALSCLTLIAIIIVISLLKN